MKKKGGREKGSKEGRKDRADSEKLLTNAECEELPWDKDQDLSMSLLPAQNPQDDHLSSEIHYKSNNSHFHLQVCPIHPWGPLLNILLESELTATQTHWT